MEIYRVEVDGTLVIVKRNKIDGSYRFHVWGANQGRLNKKQAAGVGVDDVDEDIKRQANDLARCCIFVTDKVHSEK